MTDCVSLPNAAELVNFLRCDAKELSMLANGKTECNVLWKAADVIEQLLQKAVEDDAAIALIRKKAEDEIEALLAENAKLKAELDAYAKCFSLSATTDRLTNHSVVKFDYGIIMAENEQDVVKAIAYGLAREIVRYRSMQNGAV